MKTVIEMARDCGIPSNELYHPNLERFAELVRADERNSWPAEMKAMERQVNILTDALAQEREACAKVCEDLPVPLDVARDDASVWEVATLDCASALRARGSNT
tara:strand:- start:858 stop:1166 length:309 start_codon:yes stop_codon:yes gene_type:complete